MYNLIMYEFSIPLPFEMSQIDGIAALNKKYTKSQITAVYNCMPSNADGGCGFEQFRNTENSINNFNDFAKLILYSKEKGLNFVYLLNSVKSFDLEDMVFDYKLQALETLLKKLSEIGCKKVRVANVQLLAYISEKFPDFEIYVSTSLEHSQIKQYQHLLYTFPNIKEIVPAWDINHNFTLLKNIREEFPNVPLELMVNESCISGCPFRMNHFAFMLNAPRITNENTKKLEKYSFKYFTSKCERLISKDVWEATCKSNVIYPWDIEEYGKIGITKFKLAGRKFIDPKEAGPLKICELYMNELENKGSSDEVEFGRFGIRELNMQAKEVKPYLPDIKYLVENGALCASRCGHECKYCFNCAKKLEEKFPIRDTMCQESQKRYEDVSKDLGI